VVGVTKDNLGPDFVKIARRHGFNCRHGPHRHKHRGIDYSVGSMNLTDTGFGFLGFFYYFELEGHIENYIMIKLWGGLQQRYVLQIQ